MNNSTYLLERFMTAGHTALKTWQRFLPFRQRVPAERPSRDFVAPVFVSMVIHSFLAYLLWIAVSGRTAVESAIPTTDTPLILSLSTFTADSHDGTDLEVVSEVPRTEPPVQSSSESSPGAERGSEAETVVASKDQDVPGSEASKDKSPATDTTTSFNLEAAYRMKLDFGIKPEFETETVVTSKGQGITGSEALENESLTACLTPSFGLEVVYCIEREFGSMPEPEVQNITIKSRARHIKNYIAENSDPRRNCNTAYAGAGLFAIPPLIKDAITGNGCKWGPVLKLDEQQDYIINSLTADTSKTLPPVNVVKSKIIINITKEGEIYIKGTQFNQDSIRHRIEDFANEYPDANVVINCEKDYPVKIKIELIDQIRARKIKNVVIVRENQIQKSDKIREN